MIEPGIHTDLSNDAYHGEPDYLSSSYLKSLIPERYTKPSGDSPALAFGTLVHTAVLEPDLLDEYVPLDAEKIGVKSDGSVAANPLMTVAWKRAVAEAEQDGKTVVAQADLDRALVMRDAVYAHPLAAQLLSQESARPEVSVFTEDESGVRHKARFDLLAPVAVDLKTTAAKPGADSLARAVIDYGYDLSVTHYTTVAELAGITLDAFALVFVGKTEEPWVAVAELDDTFLARGRVLRALAIERHTNPAAPRYEGADQRLTLTAPGWARLSDPNAPVGIPSDFTWSIHDYA